MNSFWIGLDGFFCQTRINFTKSEPLPTSKMELFVTIVDNYKLLTSASYSLDSTWLNHDFQRTKQGCSNVNSLVVYVNGERPLFGFIPNSKCNQDFNETILQTLSMSEKALKMLLNISDNVNAAAVRSAVNFKVRNLLVMLTQIINKHLMMNGSINWETLTETPQHFRRAKCWHKKKIDI